MIDHGEAPVCNRVSGQLEALLHVCSVHVFGTVQLGVWTALSFVSALSAHVRLCKQTKWHLQTCHVEMCMWCFVVAPLTATLFLVYPPGMGFSPADSALC